MSSIYHDGTYLEQNPTWHAEDSDWKARQIARIIGRNGLSPETVCEVGCGAGEILKVLSEIVPARYSGYEISPQAHAICLTKESTSLRFFLKDFLSEPATFDVVLAIDVFEHVPDYMGFLRSLRTKGDYKIFHIPLDLSAQAVARDMPIAMRTSVGHLHHFSKETALATLRDTGYEILDHFYTKPSLELTRGWKAALLKLPRQIMFSLYPDFTSRVFGGFSLMVLAR